MKQPNINKCSQLPEWLASAGDYFSSTAWKLILPAVFHWLIQRHTTFVDLRVDATIRTRYQLLKLYCRSFIDGFNFARFRPELQSTYGSNIDPNDPERIEPRRELE